jgi:hypothetical protein
MEQPFSGNNRNSRTSRPRSRSRSGVGVIIGGTIVAVILFTSVYIYFMVIMQSETEKAKNEVQAARFDEDKKSETFIVGPITPTTDGGGADVFQVRVYNAGTLPIEARYIMVTSEVPQTKAITPLGEIFTGPDTSKRYLNPGEVALFLANVEGDVVDPEIVYKVDVISSRGNIISASFPPDSSSGAFNTGENIGDGVPVYLGMGGDDGTVLQFRTLEAGSGIIITDPGDDGNGIGIAIDPENIPFDPRLIQQPQIQPLFPNPFGRTANAGPQALWGTVIANPSDHPMTIRKLIISVHDPTYSSQRIFCGDTPVGITPSTGWSCIGQGSTWNVLEWKATGAPLELPAESAMLFLATSGFPQTAANNDRPSVAINYNVYTDYGQFTKVGYDMGVKGSNVNHPIVNAFLSSTFESSTPSNVRGVINVQSGQQVTAIATIHNYVSGTTVDAGAHLIIDIPRSFSDVTVDNVSSGFGPCSPVEFSDGSTQIKCPLTGTLTGTPSSIQFTMTAPVVTVPKLYLLHVLGDGTSEGNTYTVGPVSENVIVVTP